MTETPEIPELERWLNETRVSMDAIASSLTAAVAAILDRERRSIAGRFHQAARRLQSAESRQERLDTVLETVSSYGARSQVFDVQDARLRLPDDAEVPLKDAPALANAVESRDVVVAAATTGELSEAVLEALQPTGPRVYLFPLMSRKRTEAVLCVEPHPDHFDANSVELICALAGPLLEEAPAEPKPANLISIATAPGFVSRRALPEWTELSLEEQATHLRAQRFARTRIAELLLNRRRQVEAGRASNDLYRELREEIDAGRETFQRQFAASCPSMVDYYHLELVRTLARGDENCLGSEYPGPSH